MRPIKEDSYTRLLTHHTTKRHRPANTIKRKPYVPVHRDMCECGKLVSVNLRERHEQSQIHNRLVQLKHMCQSI